MLQEGVNIEYLNISNIDLISKSTHRQRILNTFIRCRNQARDAGDEFDYFSISPRFANADFCNIQFLDSINDSEMKHVRPPSPSDSDEYSWSSTETENSSFSERQNEETVCHSTRSGKEFSITTNCDSIFHSQHEPPVPLPITPIPEVVKEIYRLDRPVDSTPSKLCHAGAIKTCSEIKQDSLRTNIRSANYLKRSCKLDDGIDSSKKVPRITEIESPNDRTLKESNPDHKKNVLGKEVMSSNSIQLVEMLSESQEKDNLVSMFSAKKHCNPNVTLAQSLPPNNQETHTVARGLIRQNVYSDRLLASSKMPTEFTRTVSFEDISDAMPSGSIEDFEYTARTAFQNQSYTVDQTSDSTDQPSLKDPPTRNRCEYIAGHSSEMLRNSERHGCVMGWPEGYHVCAYCHIGFGNFTMYRVHMSYHCQENPLKCKLCGLQSQNKVDFYTHITFHAHYSQSKAN